MKELGDEGKREISSKCAKKWRNEGGNRKEKRRGRWKMDERQINRWRMEEGNRDARKGRKKEVGDVDGKVEIGSEMP